MYRVNNEMQDTYLLWLTCFAMQICVWKNEPGKPLKDVVERIWAFSSA